MSDREGSACSCRARRRGEVQRAQAQAHQPLETTKPSHFCEGFVLYGAAPDERYVSARVGFSGIWSSLENSAYPN